MTNDDRIMVGIIGGGSVDDAVYEKARLAGRLLAERGASIVCGGLGGVMEAVCRGSSEAGGSSLAILPGSDRRDANPYATAAAATGMGVARNVIIVRTADVLLAIDGKAGTLSEMALALNLGKHVVVMDGIRIDQLDQFKDDPRIHIAEGPEDAVEKALSLARARE